MIRGIHGLFYSSDAEATRTFFRDKLRLPGFDSGGGWWIFDFAEGDMGVHPIEHGGTAGDHDVSFYCDDIHGTVADMKARGVAFEMDVTDHGYGLVTYLMAPGGLRIQLYEPSYKKLGPAKKAKGRAAPARTKAKATTKAGAKRKAAPKKAPAAKKPRAKARATIKKKSRPAAKKTKSAKRS